MKFKKTMTAWLVGGSIAVGGLAIGTPSQAACTLVAFQPVKNGAGKIAGTGGRETTCAGTVTLTVTVRRQRTLQPDDVIATNKKDDFGNGRLTATSTHTSGTVRTRTHSSTGAQNETSWVKP